MRLRVALVLLASVLLLSACGGPRAPGSFGERPDDCPAYVQATGGIGVALSGGGYRAALFHAGALRRMNELGLLHRADEISSVSGGSIASAQLAAFYVARGGAPSDVIPTAEWNAGFAAPLDALTARDIRSRPILEKILIPANWFREDFGVETMAEELDDHFGGLRLSELPATPDFVFQATDLSFGVSWEFRSWRVGSYRAGYLRPPPATWSLARAVAASAAFPPVFAPMEVHADERPAQSFVVAGAWDPDAIERDQDWQALPEACWKAGNWDYAVQNLRLQDGGVYDNLGLEPVWKDRDVLFVSDAGGPLANAPDKGAIDRALRISQIMTHQARALRIRMLIDWLPLEGAKVTYWSTHHPSDGSGVGGYSAELAQDYIARVRTDLDGFDAALRGILENHGYLNADAAIRETVARHPGAFPALESAWPPLAPPHPALLTPANGSDCALRKALYPNDSCSG